MEMNKNEDFGIYKHLFVLPKVLFRNNSIIFLKTKTLKV